jgi:hypothetical protein
VSDVAKKLSILRDMLSVAFEDWRKSVWEHDLDSRACCDGRECCCGGMTLREIYSPVTAIDGSGDANV